MTDLLAVSNPEKEAIACCVGVWEVCGGVWSLVVFEGWIGLDRIGFYSNLNTETFS